MIVAGVGFRSHATSIEIVRIVRRAQEQSGVDAQRLATPDFKSQDSALLEAASILGLRLMVIDRAKLGVAQARCRTRSRIRAIATGAASIAESCALAMLEDPAQLILPQIASARATCALASGRLP